MRTASEPKSQAVWVMDACDFVSLAIRTPAEWPAPPATVPCVSP
jgi:hypothetical protein